MRTKASSEWRIAYPLASLTIRHALLAIRPDLLGLELRISDHSPTARGLVGEEPRRVGGGAGHRLEADGGELVGEIMQRRVGVAIDLLHDRVRRAGRRDQREPGDRAEARDARLGDGGQLRDGLRAPRARDP